MGKRSDFKRRPQDRYSTPMEAVPPLLGHLLPGTEFIEPCAGAGDLIGHLVSHGHVPVYACDVSPKKLHMIKKRDALSLTAAMVAKTGASHIITNPPWSRPLLHRMIEHFSALLPTWLLIDANWIFTGQAAPYLKRCAKIVTIGRVKWIRNSPYTGKDDAAWMLFKPKYRGLTLFYGKGERGPLWTRT
jgi:hypothetical protein